MPKDEFLLPLFGEAFLFSIPFFRSYPAASSGMKPVHNRLF